MKSLKFNFSPCNVLKLLVISVVFINIVLFSFQTKAEPLAKDKDKFLGNIVGGYPLYIPSNFDSYWNQVTLEIGRWGEVEPSNDYMDWSSLDQGYLYAQKKGFLFREHALISGNQQPGWLNSLSLSEQKKQVEEWIRLFGERYPKANFIDVVNEPLHNPPSYKEAIGGDGKTGWDWIIWSFEKARKYCPKSKLLINDYGVLNSWVSDEFPKELKDYLTIVELLKERSLIDGIGVQAQYLENTNVYKISLILDKLAETGLPIYITAYGVDVADNAEQLRIYQEQFPVLWEHPSVKGITLWGYIEGELWREEAYLLRADSSERPALKWLKEYLSVKDNVSPIPVKLPSEDTTLVKDVAEENFTVISPEEAAKNMSPGWNMGNTLDAIPTEGAWNNPPSEEYIFDDIKKAGFKSVRIPITWQYHMGPAPDYKIDSQWMNRVEQVVDWALKRDFYVIITPHHDNDWVSKMAIDPETGKYVNDYENNIIKFEKLWEQIAERFQGKSKKLIFEILNEPDAGQWEFQLEKPKDPQNPEIKHHLTPKQMDDLNNRILKVIRLSGSYNDKRLVMVGTLGNIIEKTLKFFKIPDDKYIILTVHHYEEWSFLINHGVATWGTEQDKKHTEQIFEQLYSKFIKNGLPVIIGEWCTFAKSDKLSIWYYHDYTIKTANKYGIPCILWDSGREYFDRKNRVWRDETLKNIIINACNGITNSFIFPVDNYFKVNTDIKEDLIVKVELNSNQLIDIYNAETKLIKNIDYVLDPPNSSVTIKKEYLAKLLNTTQLGTVATLKFNFSKGVDMPLNLIRYNLPQFPTSNLKIDKSNSGGKIGSNITIPVSFNGTKLVKVTLVDKANKKPVIDAWTPYIKMINDNFDYNFDYNDIGIILDKDLLSSIKADSVFTFEFFPEYIKIEMQACLTPSYLIFIFVTK